MQSFTTLSSLFEAQFHKRHFPLQPENLYNASEYILSIAGKRVRPVCVLMGNELFNDIHPDAYHAANAIELFHNFSLIHDDIMDKAPLRRGKATVHKMYGESTALLAGDVMLVTAYDHINKIRSDYLHSIISIFNNTAKEVCEGQQIDMDFEKQDKVTFDEYLQMVTLKTSVLLASSLQMGAIIGGAGLGNQQHIYEFGKNLGIAFQVQDDYLDAFGDPAKFGKQIGGDIIANKKTFLLIQAMEVAGEDGKKELLKLQNEQDDVKVEKTLALFKSCGIDAWAEQLKETYYNKALAHLEEIAVLSNRKSQLKDLATSLLQRQK